jgi:hypothetical protein
MAAALANPGPNWSCPMRGGSTGQLQLFALDVGRQNSTSHSRALYGARGACRGGAVNDRGGTFGSLSTAERA